MATRAADDARILGEPIDMEPMSAAQRRVVHMVLAKFDDIQTESFGEGRDRYVQVKPVSEEDLGLIPRVDEVEEIGEEELESGE
jgi:hypothetical protein